MFSRCCCVSLIAVDVSVNFSFCVARPEASVVILRLGEIALRLGPVALGREQQIGGAALPRSVKVAPLTLPP